MTDTEREFWNSFEDGQAGMVEAVRADPLNRMTWLIFADWLDENKFPNWAEMVRQYDSIVIQAEIDYALMENEQRTRARLAMTQRTGSYFGSAEPDLQQTRKVYEVALGLFRESEGDDAGTFLRWRENITKGFAPGYLVDWKVAFETEKKVLSIGPNDHSMSSTG